MAFFECEFPRTLSYKAIGGPGFSTNVNKGFAGDEQRNRNWSLVRSKWTVSLTTPPASQFSGTRQQFIDLLLGFFDVVGGMADAFRLYDHKDNTFTDEPLVLVSGLVYQLVKRYTSGGRTYIRNITKPIAGTPVVDYQNNAIANTVTITGGSGTIDATTGLVTFGSAPSSPTASGQFHFPVRFDSDDLAMQIEESYISGGEGIVSLNSVRLVEVKPPNY